MKQKKTNRVALLLRWAGNEQKVVAVPGRASGDGRGPVHCGAHI